MCTSPTTNAAHPILSSEPGPQRPAHTGVLDTETCEQSAHQQPESQHQPTQLPPIILPRTSQEWDEANSYLSTTVVPAVIQASSTEEKNRVLCDGVYQYFSQCYGTKSFSQKPKKRPRRHARHLKDLTQKKNEARRRMKKARKEGGSEAAVHALAKEFHKLLRLHSKEKRAQLQSKLKIEALKARRECAKDFWRFAAKILDGEYDKAASPTFTADDAESYFRSIYSSEPRTFTRPDWLPVPPPPRIHLDEEPISVEEIAKVIKHTKSKSLPSPSIGFHTRFSRGAPHCCLLSSTSTTLAGNPVRCP